jgi:hypothetical protein
MRESSNPVDEPSRIVEIGAAPYFYTCFPDRTEFFSTYMSENAVRLRMIPRLMRALRDPALSLVVCQPPAFAPWQWQWWIRALFDRRVLRAGFSLGRAVAPQLLRLPFSAPIAVMDMDDLPVINRSNFFLLDRCSLYFKRELPVDHWQLFLKTGHPNLPTARFRRLSKYRSRLEKMRPISLGLPLSRYNEIPSGEAVKSIDVFFTGRVADASSVRARGLAELLALREEGFRIDVPDRRLSAEEFYNGCARAWLVWSPEGFGWDCFRHYEALACHAVPVINHPRIERYQPLLAGHHAIYYDPEPGGLSRAVRSALSDKDRLGAIARAGRQHVLAHHTPPAVARYVARTVLQQASFERQTAFPRPTA